MDEIINVKNNKRLPEDHNTLYNDDDSGEDDKSGDDDSQERLDIIGDNNLPEYYIFDDDDTEQNFELSNNIVKNFTFDKIELKSNKSTEITITCLSQFNDIFVSNIVNIEQSNNYNLNPIIGYRGVPDETYDFAPSVFRKEYGAGKYEGFLFGNMLKKYPKDFMGEPFSKLSKMQHHSLPTRLLDITSHPKVALYFACNGEHEADKNGKVIAIKGVFYYVNYEIQYLCAIPEIKFLAGDNIPINKCVDLLANKGNDRNDKNSIKELLMSNCVGVNAPFDHDRIEAQKGYFLLFGLGNNRDIVKNNKSIRQKLLEIDENKLYNEGRLIKCIIPKQYKQLLIDELDREDINQSTLFPDIDNYALYESKNVKKKVIENKLPIK